MWPFIPLSEVDWSVTVAGFSAAVAAGALVWNVLTSHGRARREVLSRIAETRFRWIDTVRSDLAKYIAVLRIQRYHNDASGAPVFDENRSLEAIELSHRIQMQLPKGRPHVEELKSTLQSIHADVRSAEYNKLVDAVANLEMIATAVFDTERKVAELELSGRRAK